MTEIDTWGDSRADPRPMVGERVSEQLDAIYRRERLGLLRLAYLLVGDMATAEDVVQDAFVGLYARRGSLRDPDKALTYVRSAVLNRARSVIRRRVVARRHDVRPPEPAWSAEATALLGEERREVLVALATIAPRQREVLVLRYWLDLSEAQIAETLGIAPGSVKAAASRGLDALERRLGGGS